VKNILFYVFIVAATTIYGGEPSKTLFFSPIIYRPILEISAKDKNFAADNWNPVSGKSDYSVKGVIHYTNLTILVEDKQRYDQAFTLTFSLAPHIKYNIYSKDNCIMKLIVIDEEKKQQDIYIRDDWTNSLSGYSDDYRTLSSKLILDVYSTEDMFPLFRKQHPNIDSIDFEVVHYYGNIKDNYASIAISFPSISTVKHSGMNDGNLWNGAYTIFAPKRFVSFATTIYKNYENNTEYVGVATVIDEGHNGYNCHFFPNGGIKDYVLKKSDKWENQKVWNNNGVLIGTYPFPPGEPIKAKDEPEEYFPGTWLSETVSLNGYINGYRKLSAEYWDSASKSPYYKLILSTPKNGRYLAEFFFSNQNSALDELYEKTYQKSKDYSSKNKDIILKSPIAVADHVIGNKSYGFSTKDITEEVVFLRGNLLIKLKSLNHKDSQGLARELDKAWQELNSRKPE
jgi:hypothetical protein